MQQMMIDAGMKHVTFAEASYTFNLLGEFKPRMDLAMFKTRMHSFDGLGQKRLIMYSQYFNVATMRLDRDEDYERNRQEQIKFCNAFRALGDEYIERIVPDCVKILVNECNTLGETLMRQTLHRFGVGDDNGNIMITLENLIKVIKMFHYNCT